MSYSKIYSATLVGLEAAVVEIEVDIGRGLPQFFMVGLPAKEVRESRDRVKSAIINSGYRLPRFRTTVSLVPASVKKTGTGFDLPIAIGMMLADGQLKTNHINGLLVGELSLTGQLRPVTGILSVAKAAADLGFKNLFLPALNAAEAALIKDIRVFPVTSLSQLIGHLENKKSIHAYVAPKIVSVPPDPLIDFQEINGHQFAKRALEIVAAGGHNILFTGPPGVGKTLLAKSLSSILPPLSLAEQLEVTQVHSVAGILPPGQSIVSARPYRQPHHTGSTISIIGGGVLARPGEISLAHRGVLFLDEFPEFSRHCLESLRQPLTEGEITITRAGRHYKFPAHFILVAAMNPCRCGLAGSKDQDCKCSYLQIQNYQKRISGPILDRIDMQIHIEQQLFSQLTAHNGIETSAQIRERVTTARQIQTDRFTTAPAQPSVSPAPTRLNSVLTIKETKQYCQFDQKSVQILLQATREFSLSTRGQHQIQKISRTIADLDQADEIKERHILEALQYRQRMH